MSKRAPKTRTKTSRTYEGTEVREWVPPAPDSDQIVIDSLQAFYTRTAPPPAARLDIRKVSDPKWAPLVIHFGTTTALADFLGVSEMTIGRWVKGESDPEKYYQLKIRALASVCKVPSPV